MSSSSIDSSHTLRLFTRPNIEQRILFKLHHTKHTFVGGGKRKLIQTICYTYLFIVTLEYCMYLGYTTTELVRGRGHFYATLLCSDYSEN